MIIVVSVTLELIKNLKTKTVFFIMLNCYKHFYGYKINLNINLIKNNNYIEFIKKQAVIFFLINNKKSKSI